MRAISTVSTTVEMVQPQAENYKPANTVNYTSLRFFSLAYKTINPCFSLYTFN
ncbi:MAG: hypothetical protein QXN68_02805 [Thermoplasmata archaeon]